MSKQEEKNSSKQVKFIDKWVLKLAQAIAKELIKVGRSAYKIKDGTKGFVITTSKKYIQCNREKYWFAYRENTLRGIRDCEEQYIIYGCKDESTIILLPISENEKRLGCINVSKDEDGNISHRHTVSFKDKSGGMT